MLKKLTHKNPDLMGIWTIQHNELAALRRNNIKQDKIIVNRQYVRILMSMAEGLTNFTKALLVEKHDSRNILLKPEEYVALKGSEISIQKNGTLKLRDKFYPFENQFKFVFKTYAQYHNKKTIYELAIEDDKYQLFKQTIAVRNRITHPKKGNDIVVNDHEFANADTASLWLDNFIISLFDGDVLTEL